MANAEYIAKVLGGAGAIRCMTGAKVYAMKDDVGLCVFGMKNSKYQALEVIYNEATDLFDVKFTKIRKHTITDTLNLTSVYIADLKSNCEQLTGLYFSL